MPRTSDTRHGCAAPASLERSATLRAVPLDRRPPFHHLVAPGALEQRRLEPLTRTTGVGERDLARRGPLWIQYTAGSRPPEPLGY